MARTAKLLLVLLPALAFLLGLGTWQVHRLSWKQSLIANIDAKLQGAPSVLPPGALDLDAWRFRPVTLEGRFHARDFLFPARTLNGKSGIDVLTPFERADTGALLLVHRGWAPSAVEIAPPPAPGALQGVLREPWKNTLFRPANDPGGNQWFWMDIDALTAALGTDALAPYYLSLVSDGDVGDWPQPRPPRPELPNNHLSYAITWYALALALAVIGILLIRAERRKTSEPDHAR